MEVALFNAVMGIINGLIIIFLLARLLVLDDRKKIVAKPPTTPSAPHMSGNERLLRDLYVAILNLHERMGKVRGSVPGGTAASWHNELEAIMIFVLMRKGALPELVDYIGRSSLEYPQILKLSFYEGGIRWIYEAVRDGRCPFKVDSGVGHEDYVLRDFPEILRRIGELGESTPSPA